MLRALLFAALVAGCSSGDDQETTDGIPVDGPTPWSYEPSVEHEPVLSAAQLTAAIEAWVPRLFTFEVEPLFGAWESSAAYGDGVCPAMEAYGAEDQAYTIWSDDCTAASGATFFGYSQYQFESGLSEDGWNLSTRFVYGVADSYAPEGWSLHANGYFSTTEGVRTTEQEWGTTTETFADKNLQGEFAWDGPGSEAMWIGQGLKFAGYAQGYTDGTGRAIYLQGTVSGMGDGISAVSAGPLSMNSPEWSPPCATEPTGVVSVRDLDGSWYDILFDAPTWEDVEAGTVDPAACDGCGVLLFEGGEIGQVCADLTGLVAWEGRPW